MKDQFTKQLLESLGGQVGDKLAGRNVVSRDQAVSALSSLTPVILGSLKRKQDELGESGLEKLLANAGISEHHADDIDDVLEKGLAGHSSQTEAILDEETQVQTAHALSQKLNIGSAAAKKLIPMLAPIIIGMLIKKGGLPSLPKELPEGSVPFWIVMVMVPSSMTLPEWFSAVVKSGADFSSGSFLSFSRRSDENLRSGLSLRRSSLAVRV